MSEIGSDPTAMQTNLPNTDIAVGAKRKEESSHPHHHHSKRGRGGGGRGGHRGSFHDRAGASASSAHVAASASFVPSTPLQSQFLLFTTYLDARNDRREAIFQCSRDLTRQSKKLISQLQRCTQAHGDPTERATIIAAGRSALAELHQMIATTVDNFTPDDFERYSGAFSPGFQEYIEAHSLLHYLETGELLTHQRLEADIEATLGKKILIPLSDYIVGILDLGGELMRFATNSITSGDRAIVSTICVFLRDVYSEYQKLAVGLARGGPYKEMPKKMEVWLQSLMKIEALCYKLHIRGAEIPDARMLASMLMHESNAGGGYEREAAGATDERE